MIFLSGNSIALDRAKADLKEPGIAPDISVDHDYYNQGEHPGMKAHPLQGPKQAEMKEKQVKDAIKPSGYEVGYSGTLGKTTDKGDVVDDDRVKKAIGGTAKARLGFENA